MTRTVWAALCFAVLSSSLATAEEHETEEMIVLAPRWEEPLLESSHSISVADRETWTARPVIGLDEAFELLPGVTAQSGRNFAQDSRLSIRGYGARAQFGVRGLRVYTDDIPNTGADGQSEVDSIDLAFVERVEVVRGPVSSLYGGGAGGIVSFRTFEPTETPVVRLNTLVGSDRLAKHAAVMTGTWRGNGLVAGLAWTRQGGFRQHASGKQSNLFAKWRRALGDRGEIEALFSAVWAPDGQDPGGITAVQAANSRTAARATAITNDSGEKLNQQRAAFRGRHALGAGEVRWSLYNIARDFGNSLPINRRVDLKRRITGGSAMVESRTGGVRWLLGSELQLQHDRRRNYANLAGAKGALTLRQSETVRAAGLFGQASVNLSDTFQIIGGLRYDWVEFVAGDRFVTALNGDASDRMRFREPSPRLAAVWLPAPGVYTYAQLMSAFQVPTTTELQNPTGGFTSTISPETTRGIEAGVRVELSKTTRVELTLFQLHITDVAVPQDDGTNSFFVSAGETRRRGAELAVASELGGGWSFRGAYTLSDFRIRDFDVVGAGGAITEFDGEREINVPKHAASAELRYESPAGFWLVIGGRHFTDIDVNDANTIASQGATLLDFRAGLDVRRGNTLFRPFVGARNVTGAKFDAARRLNAFGARYFEPAPRHELFAGLEIVFGETD